MRPFFNVFCIVYRWSISGQVVTSISASTRTSSRASTARLKWSSDRATASRSTCGHSAASWPSWPPDVHCSLEKTSPTSWPASSSCAACRRPGSWPRANGRGTSSARRESRATAPWRRLRTAASRSSAGDPDAGNTAVRRQPGRCRRRWSRAARRRRSSTSCSGVLSGSRPSAWRPRRHCATSGFDGKRTRRRNRPTKTRRRGRIGVYQCTDLGRRRQPRWTMTDRDHSSSSSSMFNRLWWNRWKSPALDTRLDARLFAKYALFFCLLCTV